MRSLSQALHRSFAAVRPLLLSDVRKRARLSSVLFVAAAASIEEFEAAEWFISPLAGFEVLQSAGRLTVGSRSRSRPF